MNLSPMFVIYIFRNPRLALPYTFEGVMRASDEARATVDI